MDRPFSGELGTYVRSAMDLADGHSWPVLFDKALDQVLKDGLQKDRQDVYAYRLARVNTGGINRFPSVDWGVIAECADFVTHEDRIGALSFNAIDFGERLRLSSIIQEHLAC